MPSENGIFEKNDDAFKKEMVRLSDNRNALDGLLVDGFLT
jgi:hypothetical protein